MAWSQTKAETGEYNPTIDPANFVAEISNKYFTLKPGKRFKSKNSGNERTEIVATEWKDDVLKRHARLVCSRQGWEYLVFRRGGEQL